MSPFAWGLLAGWLSALILATFAARFAYRRILRLQERAKHAERLAELGTLTGGLAHEIKNPLSTVGLNLQLLQEDLIPSSPAYTRIVNRLNTAQRETTRLFAILDDFLRYAGKLEVERKAIDVGRMLEELVDFFHPQAQLQRVNLRLNPLPEPITVQADEKLIKQAVLNLMLNGLQAMPQGGELILSASKANGEVILTVTDTGTGIDEEARQKIFDAYYSTKRGGTGLGLAMTRRIVQEHQGRVTVDSALGKGSQFSLHLPA